MNIGTTEEAGILRRTLTWFGGHERAFLIGLALAAACMWLFVELADEVMEGDTMSADEKILLALRSPDDATDPLGPGWFEEMARDVTSLGGTAILTILTLATAGYLLLTDKGHLALYLLAAVGSGMLLSLALKMGFDRPRPDLVPHGSNVYTKSFPSGHSMMSAVTFLTLGALLAGAQHSLSLKAYLIGLAAMLSMLVGLSRVYLGVHWPSDVLGGWAAGAMWALLCWAVARKLRARGTVE